MSVRAESTPRTPPAVRQGLLAPHYDVTVITDEVTATVLRRHAPLFWFIAFGVALLLLTMLVVSVTYVLMKGIGIWGTKHPIMWAWPITNFVWWIGIGHAGTLISAILLLARQPWRNSISRFAEAMTLFAVACAGLFPLLHLGRPWVFYWLLPYPNTMDIQPQYRSPLVWDVFAVSTYATVSLLFWYAALIPDLATMRDAARSPFVKSVYAVLSLGWRGSSVQWRLHETSMVLLAGLATPLVVSVHTVVSLDFTISILPGWHSTIFPPYFVAGAIFSGFAMVLVLAIPLRTLYRLEGMITDKHLDYSAQIMLATGLILAYTYVMEPFYAWYSANEFEIAMFHNRFAGPHAFSYWMTVVCNTVIPQALWSRRVRNSPPALFVVSIVVLVGMWFERYMLIITSLGRDFLPSSWSNFTPTFWDYATFFGSVGLFFTLFLLFIRVLPMISMSEMRQLLHFPEEHPESLHQ